jgi:hypothetical protein
LGYLSKVTEVLTGKSIQLPDEMIVAWPELLELRWRRGGFPLRIGGWFLGQSSVAAITLGRTIFLGSRTRLDPELLLHEYRHVQQFSESKSFPLHYIWESLRRGYHSNRFEADARHYAARRLGRITATGPDEDA